MTEKSLSEGEEFLKEWFDSQQIEFEREKVLKNLVGDNKSERIADFYLTKYHVYVEFAGGYNLSIEEKSRYNEKKRVYENNIIPCIWIYPENLGPIKFMFNKRLRTVLKKYNMKKELYRFYYHDWTNRWSLKFFAFLAVIWYLTWTTKTKTDLYIALGLSGLILIGSIYDTLKKIPT